MHGDGGSDQDGFEETANQSGTESISTAQTDRFWQRCQALRPKLASYLRAIVPDHHAVDDCLQDTFLVMAERYATVADADFPPLAFTCARNIGRTWLAKNRVGRLAILDPELLVKIAEAAARPEEDNDSHAERVAMLRDCLGRLSDEQRALIEARYGSERGATVVALAEGSGRKSDALYKKLERLRAILKRCVTLKLEKSK